LLLGGVLDLEQVHWRKLLGDLDDTRKRDMGRALAQVTVVQGVGNTLSAQQLLMADRFYEGRRTAPVDVDPVLRDLSRVYGRPNGAVAHLEPDLIGEHHVVGIDRNATELLDGCVSWIASEPEAARSQRTRNLLTVLQRATHLVHGEAARRRACALIDHLVRHHLAVLSADLIAVILDTEGEALSLLTKAVPTLDEPALEKIDAALPLKSVALMELAASVAPRRTIARRETL